VVGDVLFDLSVGRRRAMKDFLEFIAKQLVDHPEHVRVDIEEREGRSVFKLSVNPDEVGKVIGRKGKTAQAMRTLLGAIAAKEGRRAFLEIND
jgi:predicted RNA-binding protein YlqC (UPF0109 family)